MVFVRINPGERRGGDAAHKLSILASVAFGTQPAFDNVAITGVRHVIAADIAEAAALGYRIRLLGVAEVFADRHLISMLKATRKPTAAEAALARARERRRRRTRGQ